MNYVEPKQRTSARAERLRQIAACIEELGKIDSNANEFISKKITPLNNTYARLDQLQARVLAATVANSFVQSLKRKKSRLDLWLETLDWQDENQTLEDARF